MSNMEMNLTKLFTLEREIKILNSKKVEGGRELEELTKKCITLESEANKEITKKKQEMESELQLRTNELNKRESGIRKAEKEGVAIDADRKVLAEEAKRDKERKAQLNELEKSLTAAITSTRDREHLAKLRADQLEAIIKEQGETPKELPKKAEKAVKAVKKVAKVKKAKKGKK